MFLVVHQTLVQNCMKTRRLVVKMQNTFPNFITISVTSHADSVTLTQSRWLSQSDSVNLTQSIWLSQSDSVNLTQSIPLLCEFKYCDEFEFNFHWSENLVKMKRDNFWGKKDICVKLRYSKNSAWIFNLFSLPGPGLMDMNNGFRDFTAFLYPDLRTRSHFCVIKIAKNWRYNMRI